MNETHASRYTMQVGEAAQVLQSTRETVHNLAEGGYLSYVERPRGAQRWKFFDPEEVRRLAHERGVIVPNE